MTYGREIHDSMMRILALNHIFAIRRAGNGIDPWLYMLCEVWWTRIRTRFVLGVGVVCGKTCKCRLQCGVGSGCLKVDHKHKMIG